MIKEIDSYYYNYIDKFIMKMFLYFYDIIKISKIQNI